MKSQKILFGIFAIALALSARVQAQFGYSDNGNGSCTLTNYIGSGGAVIIPSNTNGLTVISIGMGCFIERQDLTSVTIPNSVTNLGDEAFADCPNLTNVYFTGNAPAAGATVFENDTNLAAYYLAGTTGWSGFSANTGIPTVEVNPVPGVVYSVAESALIAAIASGATVTFAVNGTIYLNNTIVVSNNSVLDAAGQSVAISGSNAVQLFIVKSNASLTMTHLTLENGFSDSAGGAISNAGTLQITGCAFANNSTVSSTVFDFYETFSAGGAIFNAGILQLTGCAFSNNSTFPESGYGDACGGAIYNTGTLQMTGSEFSSNSAAGVNAENSYDEDGFGAGGAVYNTGTLQMTNCAFSVNTAYGNDYTIGGGALYSVGALQINGCMFSSNSAVGFAQGPGAGSGAEAVGGAVYSGDVVAVVGSVFNGNSALGGIASGADGGGYPGGPAGGGAVFLSDQATFTNCLFSNNIATGGPGSESEDAYYVGPGGAATGGGICASGAVAVYGTTFVGNQALAGAGGAGSSQEYDVGNGGRGANATGGGLCLEAGALVMVNSTFSGNAAAAGAGGTGGDGFSMFGISPGGAGGDGGNGLGGGIGVLAGTAALTNVTLANNISTGGSAGPGGPGVPDGTDGVPGVSEGQSIAATGGTITLLNTLLDCAAGATNGLGPIVDAGYNLNSDATGYLTNSTSLNDTDPNVGLLGNYGGPTPTIPLLPGSPAMNAGDPYSFPATDQRGFPRPSGTAPDIGAFEHYPLTWTNPAAIIYGTALTSVQLSATASVAGNFAYAPTNGSVLATGTNVLTVLFTPNDLVDFGGVTDAVSLVVLPAPLTVTASNASRFYGAANPALTGTITGLANGDNITATYSTAATNGSPPGSYPIVSALADPNNLETNYTVSLIKATLTVLAAQPLVTWTNPAPIIYGATLTAMQLSANASVPGSLAYTPANGAVLATGSNSLAVVFTPNDAVDYNSVTDTVSLVVSPAPLTVTASNISRFYGTANPVLTGAISGLTNGDNIMATYSTAATDGSPPGTYLIVPSLADPSGLETNYTVTLINGILTVLPTQPLVTWTNPAAITYGAALTSLQLNASGSVPGSFAYAPTNGAVLTTGTNTLAVIFTPNDAVDYNSVTDTVSLVVSPAPLTVTASNIGRFYGTANPVLTGAISGLTNGDNIMATYSTAATDGSPPGTYLIVPSLADPSALETNYTVTLINGILTVLPAQPLVTWTNPAPIIYGGALTSVQLNASASVPGSFVYAPANGAVLATGSNALAVVFTPNDTIDYSSVTDAVTMTVSPAPLTVAASNASRFYGAVNSVLTGTIIGLTNSDNITATYSTAATDGSPPGTYLIVPLLADPSDLETNYTVTLINGILTVLPAQPLVTWTNPAPITYGAALSSAQLNASASVPGSFAYAPSNGAVLATGANMLSVVFAPNDTVDYSSMTDTVTMIVSPAPLTVTASNVSRFYGAAAPVLAGAIIGLTNGDNITAAYSTAATNSSPPGTYTIVPALVDPSDLETNYTVTLIDGTLTVCPTPSVNLVSTPSNLLLCWPTNAVGFCLQETTNFSDPNAWYPVSNITILGDQNEVMILPTAGSAYFRLKQ